MSGEELTPLQKVREALAQLQAHELHCVIVSLADNLGNRLGGYRTWEAMRANMGEELGGAIEELLADDNVWN